MSNSPPFSNKRRKAESIWGPVSQTERRQLNEQEIAEQQGWKCISCAAKGRVRTVEDIHREAWSLVEELLSR